MRFLSGFYGPLERLMRDQGGAIEFVPADFRRFGPALERIHPRVVATAAAPPDADGWCSLSLHAGATVDEIERAATIPIASWWSRSSPRFPATLGLGEHRHRIHVDRIDVLIESEREPFVIGDPEPSDAERAIAAFVDDFVVDGATLQTGIGGVPSTVASLLADGDEGDFGIHSEMFTTGLMKLHQAGKVTNHKGVYDGVSITTFAGGTRELYDWLDGNTEVRFLPVDLVNSPELIAKNRKMISINGALAVDLAGQVVADTLGRRPVLRHRRPRGLRGRLGPGARGPVAHLPAVVDHGRRGPGLADRRAVPGRHDRHHAAPPARRRHHRVRRGRAPGPHGPRASRALAAIAHPDFRDRLLAEAEVWPPA